MTPQLVEFKTHVREHQHSRLGQLVFNAIKSGIQHCFCVKTVIHLYYLVEQVGLFDEGQNLRVRIKQLP